MAGFLAQSTKFRQPLFWSGSDVICAGHCQAALDHGVASVIRILLIVLVMMADFAVHAAQAHTAGAGISDELLACGQTVAPTTLYAIIRVESGGNPFAIHVNGAVSQPTPAHDAAEAAVTAETWIVRGYSVDLGLMQVNSRNLHFLGYTVAQIFDQCTNIRAGASILTADYLAALATRTDHQAALKAALSAYNTGNFEHGFFNGYVAKYYGPYVGGMETKPIIAVSASHHEQHTAIALNPYTADPTVYHRSSTGE
jgi:type IV secretion system protein VirB1